MFIDQNLAQVLGMPFVIFVLFIVVVIALMWVIKFFDVQSNSKCTQDCNQGRNCTCNKKDQEDENWPFPSY